MQCNDKRFSSYGKFLCQKIGWIRVDLCDQAKAERAIKKASFKGLDVVPLANGECLFEVSRRKDKYFLDANLINGLMLLCHSKERLIRFFYWISDLTGGCQRSISYLSCDTDRQVMIS